MIKINGNSLYSGVLFISVGVGVYFGSWGLAGIVAGLGILVINIFNKDDDEN